MGKKVMASHLPRFSKRRLSREDQDRVERFLSAYRFIEGALRRSLNNHQRNVGVPALIEEYARNHPIWPDADSLRALVSLRNSIVHRPDDWCLAVPTLEVVTAIEEICRRLLHPRTAVDCFARAVETITPQQPISQVLALVRARDYSQFPVYEGSVCRGLLTENGLTRWLAFHSAGETLIELAEEPVANALRVEEARNNYEFAAGSESALDTANRFYQRPALEAVLITDTGATDTPLRGIATRWDILHLDL